MLGFLNKTYRNLEEQVQKNKDDIELLSFGLNIKDIVEELPATAENTEVYGVGTQAPYTYYIYLNGSWKNLGTFQSEVDGPKGVPGDIGPAGVGISGAKVENGDLYLELTDGNTIFAGRVEGPQGPRGRAGNIDQLIDQLPEVITPYVERIVARIFPTQDVQSVNLLDRRTMELSKNQAYYQGQLVYQAGSCVSNPIEVYSYETYDVTLFKSLSFDDIVLQRYEFIDNKGQYISGNTVNSHLNAIYTIKPPVNAAKMLLTFKYDNINKGNFMVTNTGLEVEEYEPYYKGKVITNVYTPTNRIIPTQRGI